MQREISVLIYAILLLFGIAMCFTPILSVFNKTIQISIIVVYLVFMISLFLYISNDKSIRKNGEGQA